MKAKEFRELTEVELQDKLKSLKEELFHLRFQNAVNQLENPMRIKAVKKDIARVFNAETTVIGLGAGVIGIGSTLLLQIPINFILNDLLNIPASAALPFIGGFALVIISVTLTLVAGLFPSKIAANKDPVEALRTE